MSFHVDLFLVVGGAVCQSLLNNVAVKVNMEGVFGTCLHHDLFDA